MLFACLLAALESLAEVSTLAFAGLTLLCSPFVLAGAADTAFTALEDAVLTLSLAAVVDAAFVSVLVLFDVTALLCAFCPSLLLVISCVLGVGVVASSACATVPPQLRKWSPAGRRPPRSTASAGQSAGVD